jgi:hypothetical protein
LLTSLMRLSASQAALVPAVGSTPLLPTGTGSAFFTTVALPTVARATDVKDGVAGATLPHPQDGFGRGISQRNHMGFDTTIGQ